MLDGRRNNIPSATWFFFDVLHKYKHNKLFMQCRAVPQGDSVCVLDREGGCWPQISHLMGHDEHVDNTGRSVAPVDQPVALVAQGWREVSWTKLLVADVVDAGANQLWQDVWMDFCSRLKVLQWTVFNFSCTLQLYIYRIFFKCPKSRWLSPFLMAAEKLVKHRFNSEQMFIRSKWTQHVLWLLQSWIIHTEKDGFSCVNENISEQQRKHKSLWTDFSELLLLL